MSAHAWLIAEHAPDGMRLLDLLAHVTYKPGWVLLPTADGPEPLTIYRPAEDSRDGSAGMIVSHHEIDFTGSDAAILRQVYDALEECEIHECQEFFRVDGRTVFDPHEEIDVE